MREAVCYLKGLHVVGASHVAASLDQRPTLEDVEPFSHENLRSHGVDDLFGGLDTWKSSVVMT